MVDSACADTFPEGVTRYGLESKDVAGAHVAILPTTKGVVFALLGIPVTPRNPSCTIPLDRIGRYFGCGPLATLVRPALVDGAGLAAEPPGPLSFEFAGFSHVRVWSADPRRQTVVETIHRALDDWNKALIGPSPAMGGCSVHLSTSTVFAAGCKWDGGKGVLQLSEGFAYRLSDGARIPAEAFFAKKKAALADTTAKCAKPYMRPAGAYLIDAIPTLAAADFKGFALMHDQVGFNVPLMLYRLGAHGSKGTPVRTLVPCRVKLKDLGTTLDEIVAYAP